MEKLIAKDLLSIGAVFLRPDQPFTWASGIKSPIYCDNRLTLTAVEVRKHVEAGLAEIVRTKFPEAEVLHMLDVLDAGDLDSTVRSISGYEKENITLIRTQQDGMGRYDFVWSAAGENGDRLGRGVILDDGNYHYCLSVLRDQGDFPVVWRDLFASFTLV